jgi:hypothetical protein
MMPITIDPKKSVVIFTHPRSGGHWFQSCLPQVDLHEPFFLEHAVKEYNCFKIKYDYWKNINFDSEVEIANRLNVIDFYHNQNIAVSVRINQYDLITSLIPKLKKHSDYQHILLKRRDISSVFWSLLIALQIDEWRQPLKFRQTITISQRNVIEAIRLLNNFKSNIPVLCKEFNPTVVYYEDALTWDIGDTWRSNLSINRIQNAKASTDITNLDEIKSWINEFGFENILCSDLWI